jgi:hypothetical protein
MWCAESAESYPSRVARARVQRVQRLGGQAGRGRHQRDAVSERAQVSRVRVRHQRDAASDLTPVVGCGRGQVDPGRRWERHSLTGDGDDVLWPALATIPDRHSQRGERSEKSNPEFEEQHFRQGGVI